MVGDVVGGFRGKEARIFPLVSTDAVVVVVAAGNGRSSAAPVAAAVGRIPPSSSFPSSFPFPLFFVVMPVATGTYVMVVVAAAVDIDDGCADRQRFRSRTGTRI